MAGLRPDSGRPPPAPPDRRTFLDVLAHSATNTPSNIHPTLRPSIAMHKGEVAILFPKALIDNYSSPYRFALVGKFSQGRPSMEIIRSFFIAQDLKCPFTIGLLDSRHVIINLQGEHDFLRLYSRNLWYISGKAMRIFKWSPHFHVDKESSIVPVWFTFPKLPIQFFNKEALFEIAKTFGRPLRLDSATTTFKRPSVARLQVEVDLLKPLPSRLWIGMGETHGFWQKIEADEELPLYCSYCWHVGHSEEVCHVKNPNLKPVGKKSLPPPSKLMYKPKENASSRLEDTDVENLEKETLTTDVATEGIAKLSVTVEGSLSPQQPPICPGNEENIRTNLLLNSQQVTSVQEHDPALLDAGNLSTISKAMDPSSSGLKQNEKEKIPVDVADDFKELEAAKEHPCKELEAAKEHPIITDGLATASPSHIAEIAIIVSVEPTAATANTEAVDLSLQGVQISTEVVKQVESELLIMEEKEFSAQTAIMHQESLGMDVVGSQHVSSMSNSTQSFHELMEDFKEFQKKINETLNKISKAKDKNTMVETVQSPKNLHMQSELSEDDCTPEQEDFIPVISKKSRRRKDYSSSVKTMQTRQLPRKDYSNFNSHSTS